MIRSTKNVPQEWWSKPSVWSLQSYTGTLKETEINVVMQVEYSSEKHLGCCFTCSLCFCLIGKRFCDYKFEVKLASKDIQSGADGSGAFEIGQGSCLLCGIACQKRVTQEETHLIINSTKNNFFYFHRNLTFQNLNINTKYLQHRQFDSYLKTTRSILHHPVLDILSISHKQNYFNS